MRQTRQAGVTLLEVTIAITLLSLLSVGMAMAMRVGLSAFLKTDSKLMDIRRVTGAQRLLQQELDGMIPVLAVCGDTDSDYGPKVAFFQGEPATMRLLSSFSLQQGWRGLPQILELKVIPGEENGVRLVVNEIPYAGRRSTAQVCSGYKPGPTGENVPAFNPVAVGARSFVLADQLAYCRFSYFGPGQTMGEPPAWKPEWATKGWPYGIRVEMAPLAVDPSRIHPITVTSPVHIRRDPEKKYEDLF
jgi:prepilin-type N-terminal cleavage/methylation domain-containing protein